MRIIQFWHIENWAGEVRSLCYLLKKLKALRHCVQAQITNLLLEVCCTEIRFYCESLRCDVEYFVLIEAF